ncbi:uncharacterized protein LOC132197906 isoform X2 [Neocloeon triangulifer]|nr:uncharacterized protein LOC132197906 isoform X2 [Neocloeon triangulifer]
MQNKRDQGRDKVIMKDFVLVSYSCDNPNGRKANEIEAIPKEWLVSFSVEKNSPVCFLYPCNVSTLECISLKKAKRVLNKADCMVCQGVALGLASSYVSAQNKKARLEKYGKEIIDTTEDENTPRNRIPSLLLNGGDFVLQPSDRSSSSRKRSAPTSAPDFLGILQKQTANSIRKRTNPEGSTSLIQGSDVLRARDQRTSKTYVPETQEEEVPSGAANLIDSQETEFDDYESEDHATKTTNQALPPPREELTFGSLDNIFAPIEGQAAGIILKDIPVLFVQDKEVQTEEQYLSPLLDKANIQKRLDSLETKILRYFVQQKEESKSLNKKVDSIYELVQELTQHSNKNSSDDPAFQFDEPKVFDLPLQTEEGFNSLEAELSEKEQQKLLYKQIYGATFGKSLSLIVKSCLDSILSVSLQRSLVLKRPKKCLKNPAVKKRAFEPTKIYQVARAVIKKKVEKGKLGGTAEIIDKRISSHLAGSTKQRPNCSKPSSPAPADSIDPTLVFANFGSDLESISGEEDGEVSQQEEPASPDVLSASQ